MIKDSVSLFVLGLAYSCHAAAQDLNPADMSILPPPAAEMTQDDFIVQPPAMPNQFASPAAPYGNGQSIGQSFGRPVIVLPMPPPPVNGMPGINSAYGFQYPGSYMPRDTPLHRFNGYVVCDPPDLTKEVPTGATTKRLVKITSTRSLAAPSYMQPCPIYTINGGIPKQKSYTTTRPSIQNAPQMTR